MQRYSSLWAVRALMLATAFVPGANARAQEQPGEMGLNDLGDSQADLVYTPVAPCRIIDTRLAGGPIAAGTTRSFKVTGDATFQGGANCGIPFGSAAAAMINFVAVSPAAQGNLQVTPFGRALPLASIINYKAGVTIANGLAVAICDPSAATCTNDITIQANGGATQLVADVQGYYRKTPALLVNSPLANTALGEGALTANTTGSGNAATGAYALSSNTTGSSNTATGSHALTYNTTGSHNTATGFSALFFNATGSGNTATGDHALNANTTGDNNTAMGDGALASNTAGSTNTAMGQGALGANATGDDNTAIGGYALLSNTTGSSNTATGDRALNANTTGSHNTATGFSALFLNNTGSSNTATGDFALFANATGDYNTAMGQGALASNISGSTNTAMGQGALGANTTGDDNTAIGGYALLSNTTGAYNTATGFTALNANTTGQYNTAMGQWALSANTTGSSNIAIGFRAGVNNVTGTSNVWIGDEGGTSESGVIRIGRIGTHTATFIAGISGATSASGVAVYVNSSGQLGTITSSRRHKEQISDMDGESDVLMKLRPVSFYYRPELDETHTRQYGLVAEEVAELAPELVVRDATGAPQTVRYHFVNAMLLNEVQKQRRLVEEQQTTIEELKARLARLEAAQAGDR